MLTWRLELDSDDNAPRLARRTARAWLELIPCDDGTKADIIVVVSEFVTHAVTDESTRIALEIVFDDGRLRIDVHGQPDQRRPPGRSEARHRGRTPNLTDRITDTVTDNWERRRTPHETHMWAEILC